MKLSQMNTEQLADCLCAITEPAGRIMDDGAIAEIIKKNSVRDEGGRVVNINIMRAVMAMVPVLLGRHRIDTFMILGAMNGKTPEEISRQNGLETMADIRACFDADLIGFFSSFGNTAKKKP